jgi:ribulose bisphosphate carboxylase small subunit
MSLGKFEEWILKNKPNNEKTLELIQEYITYRNMPLTNLHDDCPWIKNKDNFFNDDLEFTREEIKDLINHGYKIRVSHRVDKQNYYNCKCMDWDYTLSIDIEKDNNVILELFREGHESFSDVVDVFYEFKGEDGVVSVWDTT